jgi:tryptophan halogenase
MDVPDSLRSKMELFIHRGFIETYRDGLFTPPSWLSVYMGQGVRPIHYHGMADNVGLDRLVADLESLRLEIADRVEAMPSHEAFVENYCSIDPAGPGSRPSQLGIGH